MKYSINENDKIITIKLNNEFINEYDTFFDTFKLRILKEHITELPDETILINYNYSKDLEDLIKRLKTVEYVIKMENEIKEELIETMIEDDETRIEEFKQKYENEMISSEKLDLLWCDTIIKTIEFCGLSGVHHNHEYYTIHFTNGDNIDVYLSKEQNE